MYSFRRIGMDEVERVKELFTGVFTAEPWLDDWSDERQLDLYLSDLMGQGSSLAYGLFDGDALVGLSMGHIRHWYSGTEYYIDELCIRTDRQGSGLGTRFLGEIEKAIRELGLKQIFLQTERYVPAYGFYLKNGFTDLKDHVSLAKRI
ncbi:MAG: GNAT family N-acetyltransferase [Clostridia bacterium]|nr:GNAT family N-acetyltransferase [Clostridia bacterium]